MRKLFLTAVALFGLAAFASLFGKVTEVHAQTALNQDITGTGMSQDDLVILLTNLVNAVNQAQDDILVFASMLDLTGGGEIAFSSYTSTATSTGTDLKLTAD